MTEKVNLDKYQLKKEILDLPDYVLELWYGKGGLYFINELRKINRIEIDKSYTDYDIITYDIADDWLLFYNILENIFYVNDVLLIILENSYKFNREQVKNILKQIISNCEIKKVL